MLYLLLSETLKQYSCYKKLFCLFKILKCIYIHDRFLKIYVFSQNKWVWECHRKGKLEIIDNLLTIAKQYRSLTLKKTILLNCKELMIRHPG